MHKNFKTAILFARDNHGSASVIFTLALLPMLMLVGSAIDFAAAGRAKASLQAAADAAVIAAAREYGEEISRATPQQASNRASSMGRNLFTSNVPNNVRNAAITLAMSKSSDGIVTANGAYSGKAEAHFIRLLGPTEINISGTSGATYEPPYRNIFLFIDNTHSMSVGATAADRSRLASLTKPGCVFSCHGVTDENRSAGQTLSNADIAESNGIKLRMDVVREGALQIIDSARNSALAGLIYVDILPLDFNSITYLPEAGVSEIALTNDYMALASKANNLNTTLGDTALPAIGRTPLEEFFANGYYPRMSNQQSRPGRKYAVIITDGVRDRPSIAAGLPSSNYACSADGNNCVSAFDPNLCAQFKSLGATVVVFHMPYVPLPGNDRYNQTVGVIASQVAPNLRSCASPGYYFNAANSTLMSAAVDQLMDKVRIAETPRLSE